ncbi:MAG: histidine kinase [Bacteroidales bacterium]|nr:histidine kinase [Bacteroidales bacterium]
MAQINSTIQENPYVRFLTLTTDDGLSHNHILDILQDEHNYLWIATVNGLNKYDGQLLKSYQNDLDDNNSILPGIVSCIDEDENGRIWIGTENGLCVYNSDSDKFKKINIDYQNIDVNYVRAILNEGDSLLWIDVVSGYLLKFDKKRNQVVKAWEHIRLWQPYYHYHDIYRDKSGLLWLGVRNLSPLYLDEKLDKLVYLPIGSKEGQKTEYDASCYFEDSKGNFWIAGLDGAYIYDKETKIFKRFLKESTFTIIQTANGEIWFGTGSGIFQFDQESNSLQHFSADINSPTSLPNNHINKLYEDNKGSVWIATDEGLAGYRSSNNYIKFYNHIPENKASASSNFVSSSLVDKKGNVWIGYQDHGLDYFNPATGKIKHYNAVESNKYGLPSNKIKCLYEDAFGDIYIGLWAGIGFARKKKDLEQFELFTFNKTSTYQDWYNDFAEDKFGRFYLGLWGAQGLELFDREKGQFIKSLKDKFNSPFESRLITRLFYDSQDRLWMGTTRAGLHIYYPDRDTSRWFYNQAKLHTSFVDLTIYDIFESKNGKIWVAADSLFCYDLEKESFRVWGKQKGLTSNKIFKILEDETGNLWLGTDKGIISFNPDWDYCLSFPDLSGTEMTEELKAGSKLIDGQLLFGGKKGWVVFDPKTVLSRQRLPDIFLTELSVKGELKIPSLSHYSKIRLKHHENFFTVGFTNTDLIASTQYSYRYRLKDLEDNWNYIDKGNALARYTNIKPGKYILEVQLALNNSNWKNIKMKSILIEVETPLWKKTWFILSVAVLLLLAIGFAIRNLYQRIITRRKMAELKELLLRAQINPHFIFNALVAIQGYIYKKEEVEASKYLAEFSKLIRLILENTKQEYITLEKELQLLNYYLSLQKQRFKTKFSYKIDVDPNIDLTFFKLPPMLAQPFVENAIEHGAVKKESGGYVHIRLKLEKNTLVYSIEDNGIGRIKSLALKKGRETHKSFGTEITEERLSCFRKYYNYKISYQIEDLYDSEHNASGTRVTFKIPIN